MKHISHNIFSIIHRSLYIELYKVAISLQITDFTIKNELELVSNKITNIVSLFEEYDTSIYNHILAYVLRYDANNYSLFESEKIKETVLYQKLKDDSEALVNTKVEHNRIEIGHMLNIHYMEFILLKICKMKLIEKSLYKTIKINLVESEISIIEKAILSSLHDTHLSRFVEATENSIQKDLI